MANSDSNQMAAVEDIFQKTMAELKSFHQQKLDLIRRYRQLQNIEELKKIRSDFN
jgi:hypothetical protein